MDNQPSAEAEKYTADMARFRDKAASVGGTPEERPHAARCSVATGSLPVPASEILRVATALENNAALREVAVGSPHPISEWERKALYEAEAIRGPFRLRNKIAGGSCGRNYAATPALRERDSRNDARGQLVAHGCDYSATGTKEWEIIRSVRGKTNQVDLRRNGRLFKTGGSVRAKQAVKWGLWKAV